MKTERKYLRVLLGQPILKQNMVIRRFPRVFHLEDIAKCMVEREFGSLRDQWVKFNEESMDAERHKKNGYDSKLLDDETK